MKHEFTHHLETSKWYNSFVTYVFGSKTYQNWIAKKEGGERQSLAAGEKAKTANLARLYEAKQRIENGEDSEIVRQETGWYKGTDGKWRFEINDKFFVIDETALKRLKETGSISLYELIKHDELFEAYPQLKDINVFFDSESSIHHGYYNKEKNIIVFSDSENKTELRKTIIHEVQHAVQKIEGFASGSSPEYWAFKSFVLSERVRSVKKELNSLLKDIGYSEYAETSKAEVKNGQKTRSQHRSDLENFKRNSKYGEQIAAVEAEYNSLKEQRDEIKKPKQWRDYYERTAGEIEARDAANRMDYTDEQRKNTRPDIDRTDVVFADDENSYSMSTYVNRFGEQIDSLKNGMLASHESLVLCRTPKVFTNIGLNDLPVTMGQKHAEDAIIFNSAHEDRFIGENNLRALPKALENPVAIITSATHKNTSVVVLVELTGQNGKPIIVPVRLNGTSVSNGEYIDANVVVSAHERKNAVRKLLTDALNDESQGKIGIFYIDNKKAVKLAGVEGLRLPNILSKLNGFIHSISDKSSPVNANSKRISQTETKQFKRWFGNSKVVDKNGKPLIVYHGTGSEFVQFDLQKSGDNFGETSEGLFFFTNKRDGYQDSAADYAKRAIENGGTAKVLEVYLSIEKPLKIDSKGYYTPTAYFDNHAEEIYNEYLSGDYDGIIIENSDKSIDDSVIYMIDNPTKVKSATDNIGTFDKNNSNIQYSIDLEADSDTDTMSNAEIQSEMNDIITRMQSGEITTDEASRLSNELLNKAANKHGAIPKGENPKVDVTVPSNMGGNLKTRQHIRTILESGVLPDNIIYIITKKLFTNGKTCVIITSVRNSVFEV